MKLADHLRRWVNPYKLSIKNHKGRIFLFEDDDEEKDLLSKLLSLSPDKYLEIGSGSGNHLLGQAQKNPHANYIGYEIRFKRSVRTIEKAEKMGLPNVFVFHQDANKISEVFSAKSLKGIFINFPDPWEKARQQKKRILNDKFLEISKNLLQEKGFISFKTDHREYFESFLKVISQNKDYVVTEQTFDLYQSEFLAENVVTEFEKLFISQKLPIYYLKAVLV